MKQDFEVLHTEGQDNGAFEARCKGEEAGKLTYKKEGDDCLIVEHTTIEECFQGQGVGRLLVDAVVSYARRQSLFVQPECSYVKALFERVPDFQDVWVKASK